MPIIERYEADFIRAYLSRSNSKLAQKIIKKLNDQDEVWYQRLKCTHSFDKYAGTRHICKHCGLIQDYESSVNTRTSP